MDLFLVFDPPSGKGGGYGYGKGAFGAPKEAKGLVRAVVGAQVVPGGKWNNDDNTQLVVAKICHDKSDAKTWVKDHGFVDVDLGLVMKMWNFHINDLMYLNLN